MGLYHSFHSYDSDSYVRLLEGSIVIDSYCCWVCPDFWGVPLFLIMDKNIGCPLHSISSKSIKKREMVLRFRNNLLKLFGVKVSYQYDDTMLHKYSQMAIVT